MLRVLQEMTQSLSRGQRRGQNRRRGMHRIEQDSEESPEDQTYSMFTVRDTASTPIYQELLVNDVPIWNEVDMCVCVIRSGSAPTMEPLQQPSVRMKTYLVCVKVSCGQGTYKIVVQVDGERPGL